MKSPKRNQTTLRLPKELDELLTNKAKELGISKNAYILMIINSMDLSSPKQKVIV